MCVRMPALVSVGPLESKRIKPTKNEDEKRTRPWVTLKSFTDAHIPENLKEKMKELGQTIAPTSGGGSASSGGPAEKPELVPLRALQKVPLPNPEGTPEMVSCIYIFFGCCFLFFFQKKKSVEHDFHCDV